MPIARQYRHRTWSSIAAGGMPTNPVYGSIWYDQTSGSAFIWDGASWQQMGWPAQGVTDGSDAATGEVGEYRSISITNMIAIGAGVNVALTSMSLPAGDWDMEGSAYFQASNSGGTDDLRAGFNNVSAVLPDGTSGGLAIISTSSGGLINSMAIPPMRINLAATATYFLNIYADYGSGSLQARGFMRARRMR